MAVIAVTKERRAGETRVAAVPETVKKLIASGFSVTVEAGAGLAAAYPDADYAAAGATMPRPPRTRSPRPTSCSRSARPSRTRSPRSSRAR
jgi:NAD/NADP transhydrogenase alpha subunit